MSSKRGPCRSDRRDIGFCPCREARPGGLGQPRRGERSGAELSRPAPAARPWHAGEPSAEGTNRLCSQVRETCPVGNRPLLTKFTPAVYLEGPELPCSALVNDEENRREHHLQDLEHLRVILHSYSSRREGLRKIIISGCQPDTPSDRSSHNCPCCTVPQGWPLPPQLLSWHPTHLQDYGEENWKAKQRQLFDIHCSTSLAACETNTATCFGVVVSLQPFL